MPFFSRLSGEKIRENHLGESLAGILGLSRTLILLANLLLPV
jgi:hypothetical protein